MRVVFTQLQRDVGSVNVGEVEIGDENVHGRRRRFAERKGFGPGRRNDRVVPFALQALR